MPSPRLFGFRPKKQRPAEPEPDREPDDLIATLAEKVIDEGNDVPKIAAWGISPAEKYVEDQLNRRDDLRSFIVYPWAFDLALSGLGQML